MPVEETRNLSRGMRFRQFLPMTYELVKAGRIYREESAAESVV